jgi:serine/threonine-protein kinase
MFSRAVPCPSCGQPLDPLSQFCGRCGKPRTLAPSARREGDELAVTPVRLDDVLEGKWRLVKKIGEGGMGTVYLAHDLALDRPVAVKILSSTLVSDPEVVKRFEREAQLTASLEHPNIVPIYAVGSFDGRPFIVMKKLDGETLAGELRLKGGLSLPETLALMRQLCAGLDFIHAKHYVHRDIKAGNLFVGPDGLATILDFGILRPARSQEVLTRTGVVMGTPQYMSPEQALGARDVDHRADLYALAVVLYECLTGTLPFEAESELQLVQMHAHQAPPDLVQRAPWISRAVADVVARALAKRPEDRFESAGAMLTALEAAAAASPATGPGDRPVVDSSQAGRAPARTSPSMRKLARGAGLAPGQPVSDHTLPSQRLLASAAASSAKVGPETFAATGAVRPRRGALYLAGALALLAAAAVAVWLAQPGPKPVDLDRVAGLAVDAGGAFVAVDAGAVVAEADVDAGALAVSLEPDAGPDETDSDPPDAGRALEKHPLVRHPAGPGKVNVVTTHQGEPYWALVLIDGVARGRTPLLIDLPAGRHVVRVDRTGFRSQERQIKVASGRLAVVRIALSQ